MRDERGTGEILHSVGRGHLKGRHGDLGLHASNCDNVY